ncbi:hypothetical protein BOX15_Mlig025907g1, partial [Macrostomum lignano]
GHQMQGYEQTLALSHYYAWNSLADLLGRQPTITTAGSGGGAGGAPGSGGAGFGGFGGGNRQRPGRGASFGRFYGCGGPKRGGFGPGFGSGRPGGSSSRFHSAGGGGPRQSMEIQPPPPPPPPPQQQPNGLPPQAPQLPPPATLSSSPADSMAAYAEWNSGRIWQLFVEKRQTDATYERKLMLRDALLSVVSASFHSAGLFIVGSSMNGFGTDWADLDLCLTINDRELDQKRDQVLNHLKRPLCQCRFITNIELIRAKVSILKFHDTKTGLDCDLNINNPIGIYNTHLMAAYAKCDWRVRPLVMFVKLWAQSLGVQDASQGRLSSYSLALMTVQYLQAGCSPPVLYSLQSLYPQVFDYNRPYTEIDMRVQLPWEELRSQNCQNLGQLFSGFVQYYSEFDWRGFSVSVRLGKPLPIQLALKLIPAHEQLLTANSYKIYVEEPFSLTNAARSVHSDEVFAQIQRAFRVTAQSLRNQRSLSDILSNSSQA